MAIAIAISNDNTAISRVTGNFVAMLCVISSLPAKDVPKSNVNRPDNAFHSCDK